MMLWIRFNQQEFILPQGNLEQGPIATVAQYAHGLPSYAHLYRDGRILRFGSHLGNVQDLTVLGEIADVPIARDALTNVLDETVWQAPQ